MSFRFLRLCAVLLLANVAARAQSAVKILFDATKAETAGNADWVIDADVANSPQRLPTPAQSTVTASTPEGFWTGALSSWGIALVNRGYQVETLPATGRITYNDASNPQDLHFYAAYIVDEPNIRYTAAEKTAILNYVRGGGGLFMISDHTMSDRNGDGWDSPAIWNDLMSTNTVQTNPFGLSFDLNNLTFTTGVGAAVAPTDSLLHGPAGNPVAMEYHNGASRVAALGDSSPPDDGTGAPGNNLYDGWAAEANGDHARLLTNATIWLATPNRTATATRNATPVDFSIYPNPSGDAFFISGNVLPVAIHCHNAVGQEFVVAGTAAGVGALRVSTAALAPGVYVLSLHLPDGQVLTRRLVRQ